MFILQCGSGGLPEIEMDSSVKFVSNVAHKFYQGRFFLLQNKRYLTIEHLLETWLYYSEIGLQHTAKNATFKFNLLSKQLVKRFPTISPKLDLIPQLVSRQSLWPVLQLQHFYNNNLMAQIQRNT